MYGLLLPNKSDSSANKTKPHPPESRDDHMTSDDITAMTSDPSITRRDRGRERRRNRQSVIVGTDDGGRDVKVHSHHLVCVRVIVEPLQVRSESKGGRSDVVMLEGGKVSSLVRQFDDVDSPSQVYV